MTGTNFLWFVAGLATASVAFFVIGPFLRRAKTVAVGVAVATLAIVGVYFGLYFWLSHPRPVPVTPAAHALTEGAAAERQAAAMDSDLDKLEVRLAQGGGSDADWDLLAQGFAFQGRTADAEAARNRKLPTNVTSNSAASDDSENSLLKTAGDAQRRGDYVSARAAFAKLAAMQKMTADSWADYADVTSTLQGKLSGEPEQYLQAALTLNPEHPKALWLKASLEHETHHYAEAIVTWRKLAGELAAGSSDATLVAANLAEDQKLADPSAATGTTAQAAAPVSIHGNVVLADTLRAQVSNGLTLFIVAKSVDSPGAPVAVMRTTTGTWPLKFELDDSMAMLPTRKLSTAGKVTIEARVSKSGLANRQAGDLLGETPPLDPATAGVVQINIARVID
jgi:cytochrome c-type biogenesis protein CcmH/NrfG